MEQQLTTLQREETTPLNYELNNKVEYLNLLVLSKPEILRLRVLETKCPHNNHRIKVVKLFSLDDKICPIHHLELDKSSKLSQLEVYAFYVQGKEDKFAIFIPADKFKTKLGNVDIYNRINISGFDINVQTKNKGIFNKGALANLVDNYEEQISNQRSMLQKGEVIELFGIDKPKLNMSDNDLLAYKHALLLPLVQTGINILTIGNPGTMKTEFALTIKELSGGAYIDATNASDVGLIGMAVRNYDNNGYHFEGGAIMSAKGKALIADEGDKTVTFSFFRHLNSITANHFLSFRKGNVHYEDDKFFVSCYVFGNPIYTRFQNIPKTEIDQTFRHNKEFLSRMHLIFALNCKEPDPKAIRQYDLNSLKIYIQQARAIKITERDIEEDAKEEMHKLYKENVNDERFFKKLTDLVIAEAKFSFHNKVTIEDVKAIREILDVQRKMLYR